MTLSSVRFRIRDMDTREMCRCCGRYEAGGLDRLCIKCRKLACMIWELAVVRKGTSDYSPLADWFMRHEMGRVK